MRVLFPRLFLIVLWSCGLPLGFTQTQADFFNDTTLNDVRITMRPVDWQTLKQNYLANTYYPIIWQWKNITLEGVEIRSRGTGSRSPVKPGLRVDFNHDEPGQTFLGLKSVVMRNNTQDPSMMHEILSLKLFARMGLPACREAYVRFFVNDEYIGLYTIVESVDRNYLKRTLNEDEGYLYKYDYNAGDLPYYYDYKGSDLRLYSPSPFKPETHEDRPNPASLEAWIRTMNNASGTGFEQTLAPYLNIRQFIDHIAIEQFLADEDGVLGDFGTNNFYLYRFTANNLHRFLVWDKSNTFRGLDRDIMRNSEQFVPMKKILEVPELKTYFLQRVLAVAQSASEGGWMRQQIDAYYNLIQQAAYADPNKQCQGSDGLPRSCSNAEFDAEVNFMRSFADNRLSRIQAQVAANGLQLAKPPQVTSAGIVSAATFNTAPANQVARGQLISLFGSDLTSGGPFAAASLPLPTQLGTTSVQVNGSAIPLILVSGGQINAQLPFELGETGTATLTVTTGGQSSSQATVDLRATSPGIFSINSQGNGDGAILHGVENTLVTAASPARPGEVVVIFCTGLGATNPAVASGRAASGEPTTNIPTVTFGGVTARVDFAGLAPGFVGLYQVNTVVPSGVSGRPAVVITSAGNASRADVTVPVQ